MPVDWTGRWEGGRIATVRGREVYYIERSLGTRRARKTLTHCLGAVTIDQARAELALFERDPFAYRTAEQQRLETVREAERKHQEAEASKLIITEGLIEKFIEALRKGYRPNDKPATDHYLFVTHAYLSKWATGPLYNRDLRAVKITELREHLDALPAGAKHWIVAIKSLTAWLRWRGDLKPNEDETTQLTVPKAKKLSPDEKEEKVYSVKELELTYQHLPNQDVRDVFRVRIMTGLHVSEIRRIAEGKCVIKPVAKSQIAATVDVLHKSGQTHRQSVDAATLAALKRLQVRKTFPTEKTFERCRKKAAEASGQPEVFIGLLRHTYTTMATERGKLIAPPASKGQGVPLSVVSQLVGHQDVSTTRDFYLGQSVPPMVALPIKLHHSKDPVALKAKRRAGREEQPAGRQQKAAG